MTDSRILPGARARLVDAAGVTTREFYDFFRRLQESGTPDAQLEELARRLGSPDGSIDGIPPLPTDYVRTIAEGQGIRITGGDGAFTISTRYAGGAIVNGPTSDEAFASIDNVLVDTASTGIRVGGYGSVVGGIGVGTTVSVTAGVGSILDLTDRANPVFTEVSWGAFTGIAVANTSVPLTWWYIDAAGALQQQTTKPTDSEYRDRIYLFRTGFTGGVISSLVPIVNPLQNTAANLGDLARAISTLIISGGGRVSPNGVNLKVTRNSGQLLSWGANYAANAKDPHEIQLATESPLTFRMVLSTGNPASPVTDLPVGFYESGGVVTAVPGATNRACIFTVFQLPSGNVVIQYDNTFYTSIAEARVALSTGARNFVANPTIAAADGIASGFIIATKGATNLSDETQAVFFATNKFGEFGGGAAAGAVARWGGIIGNIADQADLFTTFQPLDAQLTSLAALSYAGNAGKVVAVNAGETAFELVTGGGGGGSAVNVQDEGSTVVTGATAINFVGTGVTATNGGGGVATVTIPGGLTNPMTTAGDIITGGTSGTPQRLGIGSSGQVLTVVSGAPAWQAQSAPSQPLATKFVGSIMAGPNASAVTATGLAGPSPTGSAGAGAIASTNVFSSLSRRTLNATAATNAIAGQRSADGNFLLRGNSSRVGGFRIVQRIGVGTGGTIASHRLFVGISENTAAPTDVNPSSLTNVVLFGYDSGDTNCQVMHNDGAGTATKIDLGASFPKPTTANEKVYDFDLSCTANSSSYSYTVTDVSNGNTTSGTISTDIPANTLLMNWRHWMSAGGTSTAILLAFYFLYVEQGP